MRTRTSGLGPPHHAVGDGGVEQLGIVARLDRRARRLSAISSNALGELFASMAAERARSTSAMTRGDVAATACGPGGSDFQRRERGR